MIVSNPKFQTKLINDKINNSKTTEKTKLKLSQLADKFLNKQ